VTLDRLISSLIASKNEAADDALLEAMTLGSNPERTMAMEALFRRQTIHGLTGLVGIYGELPGSLQTNVLKNIKLLHHAIREAGRSERVDLRLNAMKLIALGRQGKLAYVISENLHNANDTLAKAAAEALVQLARWISTETGKLQKTEVIAADSPDPVLQDPETLVAGAVSGEVHSSIFEPSVYLELLEQRPEIEQAVARALDTHRGKYAADLIRAGLLLSDWPGSKTLAILHTAKHGGQTGMLRRMQQAPASEGVDAFLLGASHGGLRSHFGLAFSHIEEAPALDALLRRTHWLKDNSLQSCMHLVSRGAWLSESELLRDISRRDCGDAARIGEWIAATGAQDVVQDERLCLLRSHAQANDPANFAARLRLLRIACRRKPLATQLLKAFLNDPDERLVRMATREIIRRRPADYENQLLQRLSSAPDSVRRVIGRSVGHSGFEQFWSRYDKLDKATRKQAGRALLKLLPDSVPRLSRKLAGGPMEQRLQAMQMIHELNLAEQMVESLLATCSDPSPRLRSRAVSLLSEVPALAPDPLIERLLCDTDSRVRANAIEVLESKHKQEFVPLLIQRARAGSNRERANAIKVMHKLRMNLFGASLQAMLNDPRPEHRISAMWALKQTGWWNLIGEVGKMAKSDADLKVRRYAVGVLKAASELIREQRLKAAG
jgi:HEAT repeat protein